MRLSTAHNKYQAFFCYSEVNSKLSTIRAKNARAAVRQYSLAIVLLTKRAYNGSVYCRTEHGKAQRWNVAAYLNSKGEYICLLSRAVSQAIVPLSEEDKEAQYEACKRYYPSLAVREYLLGKTYTLLGEPCELKYSSQCQQIKSPGVYAIHPSGMSIYIRWEELEKCGGAIR